MEIPVTTQYLGSWHEMVCSALDILLSILLLKNEKHLLNGKKSSSFHSFAIFFYSKYPSLKMFSFLNELYQLWSLSFEAKELLKDKGSYSHQFVLFKEVSFHWVCRWVTNPKENNTFCCILVSNAVSYWVWNWTKNQSLWFMSIL